MSVPTREDWLKAYASAATDRLIRAGDALAARQVMSGPARGNVPPWPGSDDADLHGTLAALWIWGRAQRLEAADRFSLNIATGWSFVESAWRRFIPDALDERATEEAPYDCAMVLRAVMADADGRGRDREAVAARLLAGYLSDLEDLGGREFQDPGFLAWTLAEHARERGDRALLATARRFIDRAFGMKMPPPFDTEPALTDVLFDFSCTSATRVLSVLAAEGATPFVGAWLRERVLPVAPKAFVPRPRDENIWNACAAVALGRAFVVSTDPQFLEAHQAILTELEKRAPDGKLGRQPGFSNETAALFYYALAIDALVKV
jgi:hypothetical protein